jgi:ABC-type cobalamin/Fe3+-siderophores transport system ATPase subunit
MTTIVGRGLVVRRSGRAILDGVDVALRPGELVGIIGPNGAGKSTLLRSLAGLVELDGGEVLLGGRPLHRLSGPERTRLVGHVPQRFEPAWNYSVREILEMGAMRGPVASDARAAANVEHELEALLDRRWSALSGGERARTLLASVLVTRPPVLLADEPGASLDIRHRYSLLKRLRAYASESAVAVVLHEIDLALRFCDRLVVLADGRVAFDGPQAELARSPVLDDVFRVTFSRISVRHDEAVPLPIPL